jgi:hypothetical protein
MAQSLDNEVEGRGGLPAARIIQVVPRPRWAPVLENSLEASGGYVRQCDVLRDVSKPEAVHRGIEDLEDAIKHELPLDPDSQLVSITFEFPGIKPTIGGKAQIDAGVTDQVLRGYGPWSVREI